MSLDGRYGTGMERTVRGPIAAARALAFWGAVVVPVAYVPLLVAGIDGETAPLFAGLVCLNVLCLLAGHGYSP